MASADKPIHFIKEFCEGKPRTSKVFKLVWTSKWAQICDFSMSVEDFQCPAHNQCPTDASCIPHDESGPWNCKCPADHYFPGYWSDDGKFYPGTGANGDQPVCLPNLNPKCREGSCPKGAKCINGTVNPICVTMEHGSKWSTIKMSDELDVSGQNVLFEGFRLPHEYRMYFDLKPTGKVAGWTNILRLTAGGWANSEYGGRNPMFSFWPNSNKLQISTAANGDNQYQYSQELTLDNHPSGEHGWTSVVVEQRKTAEGLEFSIGLNDALVHKVINTKPILLESAQIMASDPKLTSAKAVIRNFELKTSNLYTLDGDEALAKATMIGRAHGSGNYNFNKAFDSNKNRDESSLYHSADASKTTPQGVEITFDTVTRVHEVTIVPRGMASTLDR